MTQLSLYLYINFEWNDPFPFYRVYINVLGSRTLPLGLQGGLDRKLESIPPLKVHTCQLILIISL